MRGAGDALTRTGFLVLALRCREMQVLAAQVVVLAIFTARTGTGHVASGLAMLLGAASWMISEYFFHRFVLHMPRPPWRWLRRVHRRIHWQHHQTPDDPAWLFVPPWGSPLLIGIGMLVGGLAGGWPWAVTAGFGYGVVLVHYELMHLAAHVPYRPRTRLGAFMKRHHLLHHYKNERYWFGVTNPLMDLVMGTWPARDAVDKSKTARTLGVDPP